MSTEKTKQLLGTKNDRVYVRLNSQLKREFEMLSKVKGLTPSAMLHSFVVRSIYEERQKNPSFSAEIAAQAMPETLAKDNSLSEKLIATKGKKTAGKDKTFTTGDGMTMPLVDEGFDES